VRRLLITGASGLLGGCLLRRAARLAGWEPVGTARTARGNLVAMPLEEPETVRALITDGGFESVVHCAALRSPEACRAEPDRARAVNAAGSVAVADAARRAGARLLYVSTDYVFDGEDPPYDESAEPQPINLYGETKLAGERAARPVPGGLIVRIPALYRLDLADDRNWVAQLANDLGAGRPLPLDAETARYYTLAEDVAAALLWLLDRGESGIVHLSAEERSTKADFARAVARALGHDPARITDAPPAADGAPRPRDSHLDPARYRALGGPALRGHSEVLPELARRD
jgi:dTDP-4-dehydrorhamnose reductase